MAAMKGFKDLKEIEEPSKSTPSREGAGDDDQAPLKEPNGNVAAPEAEAADHDVDAPPGAGSDWRAPIFRCCSRGWSGSVVWCNRVDGVLVSGKFLPVFADFLDDRVQSRLYTAAVFVLAALVLVRAALFSLLLGSQIQPGHGSEMRMQFASRLGLGYPVGAAGYVDGQRPAGHLAVATVDVGQELWPSVDVRVLDEGGNGIENVNISVSVMYDTSADKAATTRWDAVGTVLEEYGECEEGHILWDHVPVGHRAFEVHGLRATTDSNGLAKFGDIRFSIALPGLYTLDFETEDSINSLSMRVRVTNPVATIEAAAVSQEEARNLSAASTTVGAPMPVQPTVRLLDASGSPVRGVAVRVLAVDSGVRIKHPSLFQDYRFPRFTTFDGSVSSVSSADGIASFSNLTVVGAAAQHIEYVFAAGDVISSVQFMVLSQPQNSTTRQLHVLSSGTAAGVEGTVLPEQPVLQIFDSSGLPMEGLVVYAVLRAGPLGAFDPGTQVSAFQAAGHELSRDQVGVDRRVHKQITGFASAPTDSVGIARFSNFGFTAAGPAGTYVVGFVCIGAESSLSEYTVSTSVARVEILQQGTGSVSLGGDGSELGAVLKHQIPSSMLQLLSSTSLQVPGLLQPAPQLQVLDSQGRGLAGKYTAVTTEASLAADSVAVVREFPYTAYTTTSQTGTLGFFGDVPTMSSILSGSNCATQRWANDDPTNDVCGSYLRVLAAPDASAIRLVFTVDGVASAPSAPIQVSNNLPSSLCGWIDIGDYATFDTLNMVNVGSAPTQNITVKQYSVHGEPLDWAATDVLETRGLFAAGAVEAASTNGGVYAPTTLMQQVAAADQALAIAMEMGNGTAAPAMTIAPVASATPTMSLQPPTYRSSHYGSAQWRVVKRVGMPSSTIGYSELTNWGLAQTEVAPSFPAAGSVSLHSTCMSDLSAPTFVVPRVAKLVWEQQPGLCHTDSEIGQYAGVYVEDALGNRLPGVSVRFILAVDENLSYSPAQFLTLMSDNILNSRVSTSRRSKLLQHVPGLDHTIGTAVSRADPQLGLAARSFTIPKEHPGVYRVIAVADGVWSPISEPFACTDTMHRIEWQENVLNNFFYPEFCKASSVSRCRWGMGVNRDDQPEYMECSGHGTCNCLTGTSGDVCMCDHLWDVDPACEFKREEDPHSREVSQVEVAVVPLASTIPGFLLDFAKVWDIDGNPLQDYFPFISLVSCNGAPPPTSLVLQDTATSASPVGCPRDFEKSRPRSVTAPMWSDRLSHKALINFARQDLRVTAGPSGCYRLMIWAGGQGLGDAGTGHVHDLREGALQASPAAPFRIVNPVEKVVFVRSPTATLAFNEIAQQQPIGQVVFEARFLANATNNGLSASPILTQDVYGRPIPACTPALYRADDVSRRLGIDDISLCPSGPGLPARLFLVDSSGSRSSLVVPGTHNDCARLLGNGTVATFDSFRIPDRVIEAVSEDGMPRYRSLVPGKYSIGIDVLGVVTETNAPVEVVALHVPNRIAIVSGVPQITMLGSSLSPIVVRVWRELDDGRQFPIVGVDVEIDVIELAVDNNFGLDTAASPEQGTAVEQFSLGHAVTNSSGYAVVVGSFTTGPTRQYRLSAVCMGLRTPVNNFLENTRGVSPTLTIVNPVVNWTTSLAGDTVSEVTVVVGEPQRAALQVCSVPRQQVQFLLRIRQIIGLPESPAASVESAGSHATALVTNARLELDPVDVSLGSFVVQLPSGDIQAITGADGCFEISRWTIANVSTTGQYAVSVESRGVPGPLLRLYAQRPAELDKWVFSTNVRVYWAPIVVAVLLTGANDLHYHPAGRILLLVVAAIAIGLVLPSLSDYFRNEESTLQSYFGQAELHDITSVSQSIEIAGYVCWGLLAVMLLDQLFVLALVFFRNAKTQELAAIRAAQEAKKGQVAQGGLIDQEMATKLAGAAEAGQLKDESDENKKPPGKPERSLGHKLMELVRVVLSCCFVRTLPPVESDEVTRTSEHETSGFFRAKQQALYKYTRLSLPRFMTQLLKVGSFDNHEAHDAGEPCSCQLTPAAEAAFSEIFERLCAEPDGTVLKTLTLRKAVAALAERHFGPEYKDCKPDGTVSKSVFVKLVNYRLAKFGCVSVLRELSQVDADGSVAASDSDGCAWFTKIESDEKAHQDYSEAGRADTGSDDEAGDGALDTTLTDFGTPAQYRLTKAGRRKVRFAFDAIFPPWTTVKDVLQLYLKIPTDNLLRVLAEEGPVSSIDFLNWYKRRLCPYGGNGCDSQPARLLIRDSLVWQELRAFGYDRYLRLSVFDMSAIDSATTTEISNPLSEPAQSALKYEFTRIASKWSSRIVLGDTVLMQNGAVMPVVPLSLVNDIIAVYNERPLELPDVLHAAEHCGTELIVSEDRPVMLSPELLSLALMTSRPTWQAAEATLRRIMNSQVLGLDNCLRNAERRRKWNTGLWVSRFTGRTKLLAQCAGWILVHVLYPVKSLLVARGAEVSEMTGQQYGQVDDTGNFAYVDSVPMSVSVASIANNVLDSLLCRQGQAIGRRGTLLYQSSAKGLGRPRDGRQRVNALFVSQRIWVAMVTSIALSVFAFLVLDATTRRLVSSVNESWLQSIDERAAVVQNVADGIEAIALDASLRDDACGVSTLQSLDGSRSCDDAARTSPIAGPQRADLDPIAYATRVLAAEGDSNSAVKLQLLLLDLVAWKGILSLGAYRDALNLHLQQSSAIAGLVAGIIVVGVWLLMIDTYKTRMVAARRGRYRLIWHKNRMPRSVHFIGYTSVLSMTAFVLTWAVWGIFVFLVSWSTSAEALTGWLDAVALPMLVVAAVMSLCYYIVMEKVLRKLHPGESLCFRLQTDSTIVFKNAQFLVAKRYLVRYRNVYMLFELVFSIAGFFTGMVVAVLRLVFSLFFFGASFMRADVGLFPTESEHLDPASAVYNGAFMADALNGHPVRWAFIELLLAAKRLGAAHRKTATDEEREARCRATRVAVRINLAIVLSRNPELRFGRALAEDTTTGPQVGEAVLDHLQTTLQSTRPDSTPRQPRRSRAGSTGARSRASSSGRRGADRDKQDATAPPTRSKLGPLGTPSPKRNSVAPAPEGYVEEKSGPQVVG